jgi:hypothetical protein
LVYGTEHVEYFQTFMIVYTAVIDNLN